ncbi:hypothetical protein R6Q57_013676 [Mikania cordata]
MDANMEELEKKIGKIIEEVRDTMLDRLSGVDRKLTVIAIFLKKIIVAQEKRCNGTGVNNGGGTNPSKNQDQRKRLERVDVGGPLHESGPKKPLQAVIPQDGDNHETDVQIWGPRGWLCVGDQGKQGPQWEAGTLYRWLSLYNPPEPDFGVGTEKSWMGSLGKRVVKMSQDDNSKYSIKVGDTTNAGGEEVQTRMLAFWGKIKDEKTDILLQNDSLKNFSNSEKWGMLNICTGSSSSWGKVADKTDAGGEEVQTRSLAFWGKIKDEKTDILLQDFSKPDQWAKKDSDSRGKAIQNVSHCKRASVKFDLGLDWKEGGQGPKRKHPDSLVRGPHDGSGGLFTTSKQRLDTFRDDEENIFNDIDTIMKSINIIMHLKGYKDEEHLSADDQNYILENVFNYHRDQAQKKGARIDHIMVNL